MVSAVLDPGSLVLSGSLLVAIPLAMAAGLVSFLSPCCLPLVPGYLAYVSGSAGADASNMAPRLSTAIDPTGAGSKRALGRRPSRTVMGTGLFVVGFAAVFTSYGAAFGFVGAQLAARQDVIVRVLGVVTIAMGLVFSGALARLPWSNRSYRIDWKPRVGLAGAPLPGVMFGVGWTPCIGPTLAAVLSLSMTEGGAARGAMLSFAYSLGIGIPFLLASLGIGRAFSAFSPARRHARHVMQAGGLMLVAIGVLQVSGLWTSMLASLQGTVVGWQAPL